MKFESKNPYPTPKVEKPNLEYAKILMDNYAGKVSEETAVHLYMYQHLIMDDELEEFATAMKRISIVEMKHLGLIGETIKLLGLKPVFGTMIEDNYVDTWNSMNVNYTTDLKEMLETDIKNEQEAIKNYEKRIIEIDDRYIRELLLRIIEDEEIHLRIFKKFYKDFGFEK